MAGEKVRVPPCRGCDKRWVDADTGKTCHADCDKYKLFRESVEDFRKNESEWKRGKKWNAG